MKGDVGRCPHGLLDEDLAVHFANVKDSKGVWHLLALFALFVCKWSGYSYFV